MKHASAYIWSFIGRFGVQLFSLLTTLILARLLTPTDFGTIGVLSVVFIIANTLADSGLGGALMMEKELNNENCGTVFVFNFVISLLLCSAIFISSSYIEHFYSAPGLSEITRALCFVFLFNSFGVVPKSILIYQLKFKELSLTSLLSTFIASVFAISMAYCGWGVWALVAMQLASAIISTVSACIISHYYFSICFNINCFKRMFSFGIFTTIANIMDSVYENAATVIFGKFLTVGDAGYLAQAKKIEETSSQSLMMTINATSYPILSKLKDDISEFVKEANNLLTVIPLIITPILIVVGVYSKEVILLLFGKNWLNSAPYLGILIFAGYFMIIESISRNLLKSLGEVRVLFFSTVIKRAAGCALMLCLAFVSVNLILIGYVIGAFVGYMITSWAYAMLIRQNYWRIQYRMLLKTIPLLCLLCIIKVHYVFFDSISVNVVISTFALIVYYLLILPKLGLPIKSIINWIKMKYANHSMF